MKAKAASTRRSACPLNATLEALGDRWSLLIVRDLMFRGRNGYKDFLEAEEGIATNILARRLQRLEVEGVVEKQRDPGDARRFIYRLTPKGLGLAPLLVEMIVWGARYYRTGAPPKVIRDMTDDREGFLAALRGRLASDKRGPTGAAGGGRSGTGLAGDAAHARGINRRPAGDRAEGPRGRRTESAR